MYVLPAALADEAARTSTRIGYLVEITPVRTGTPFRLCSMTDIEWDGHTWPHRGFVCPQPPVDDGNSARSWSIAIDNTDKLVSGLALAYGLRGARFRWWRIACGNPAPALGDVQPLVWGWLVDDSCSSDTVEASVSTEYSIESITPRQRIFKPVFNWPPAPNTTVAYNGGVVQFTES